MIKLAKPYISKEAIEEVTKVLKSGYLIQGQYVKEFEKKLGEYLSVKHSILVSSGTAALHLSLIALDIKLGDEIIVPAFTFPATANVVELVGATPVFIDINLEDFCIDTSKIESAITKKTKAIIPVHEFGQPAKMDDILEIAKIHELKIIEDAACALGAEFGGKKVGTFGEIGCFSFHPRKAITTGEGGAIVTNDTEVANKVRSLRNHGIQMKNGKTDFIYAGMNYRMTDFQAALGISQLKLIEKLLCERIKIARNYDENLDEYGWLKTPSTFSNRRMIYQTYHILVNPTTNRDQLIDEFVESDIETNIGAQAVTELSYYKSKYNLYTWSYANAITAYNQGIALPIGNHLTQKQLDHIFKSFKNVR